MTTFLHSQRDPSYQNASLGRSNLRVSGFGCFLVSLANLYQKHPTELLVVNGAFNDAGLIFSDTIAKYCGGRALGATNTPPDGWCIARTRDYADQGYETHFFCYNNDTKQMIDPLVFPAKLVKNTYRINQYRPFSNIKLDTSIPIPIPVFPDVEIGRWSEEAVRYCKEKGIMKGGEDGLFRPTDFVTREELAVVVSRLPRLP